MTAAILTCVIVSLAFGLVGFFAGRRVGRGDTAFEVEVARQEEYERAMQEIRRVRSSIRFDDHEGWERLIGFVHKHDPEECPGCKTIEEEAFADGQAFEIVHSRRQEAQ